jgi:hypothetical protein
MALRPQYPEGVLTDSLTASGTVGTATHTSGASDGSVNASVVVSTAITGEDYVVTFSDTLPDGSKVINWSVTSGGTVVSPNNTIQGGLDFATAKPVGTGANPIIDGLLFEVNGPPLEFKDFRLVANAAGAVDPAARASASWRGYPSLSDPGGNYPGDQMSLSSSWWFLATNSTSNYAYEKFIGYVTRYSGGYGNPDGGIGQLIPDDFEFRFTEKGSKMFDWWGTELLSDSPLEIWNIGDITDPSDDFQMFAIFDDANANGVWDLQQKDSPMSGASNDPMTEGLYIVEHMDRAPGTAGYEALVAAFTADPMHGGNYPWASGPGLPLAGAGQTSRAMMMNIAFIDWNGGDVTADPWVTKSPYPETGSVFQMITTKPNSASDVFTLQTGDMKPQAKTVAVSDVSVWPNPYFGYNPEERNPVDQQMHFTHLPESGSWKIRIFDLAGNHVRTIDGSNDGDGSQFSVWDLRNDFGVPVASGMYLAHVESGSESKILKLAVVQPEQRLDRY